MSTEHSWFFIYFWINITKHSFWILFQGAIAGPKFWYMQVKWNLIRVFILELGRETQANSWILTSRGHFFSKKRKETLKKRLIFSSRTFWFHFFVVQRPHATEITDWLSLIDSPLILIFKMDRESQVSFGSHTTMSRKPGPRVENLAPKFDPTRNLPDDILRFKRVESFTLVVSLVDSAKRL